MQDLIEEHMCGTPSTKSVTPGNVLPVVKSFFKVTYAKYTNFGLQRFRLDYEGTLIKLYKEDPVVRAIRILRDPTGYGKFSHHDTG